MLTTNTIITQRRLSTKASRFCDEAAVAPAAMDVASVFAAFNKESLAFIPSKFIIHNLRLRKNHFSQSALIALIFAGAVEALAASSEAVPPMDVIKFSGLSPEAAAREISLP